MPAELLSFVDTVAPTFGAFARSLASLGAFVALWLALSQ